MPRVGMTPMWVRNQSSPIKFGFRERPDRTISVGASGRGEARPPTDATLIRAGVAATVLAGVGESDCIENPMTRFGVAEKTDNHDCYYKRNLYDPHVRSAPGDDISYLPSLRRAVQ
jgi:hypothetical protein